MMRGVGMLVALLGCAGCAAPRTYFQQPRLVVGACESEWATHGSWGARVLRPVVQGAATTLVWVPLSAEGLLEGVSLGEVDAGLVRAAEWDASATAAVWIEASASRNGYHLLVGKGAGLHKWIVRWEAGPALDGGGTDARTHRPE